MSALYHCTRYLDTFSLAALLHTAPRVAPLAPPRHMRLGANAVRQLELLRNNADFSRRGTLLHVLDATCTAPGQRLLRKWIT